MPLPVKFNIITSQEQLTNILEILDNPTFLADGDVPTPPKTETREPVAKKMAILAHLPAEYPPDLPKFLHKQVLAERYSSDLEAPWAIFAYDPAALIQREFQVPASCLRILDDPVPSTPPDDDIAF
jgi:hypothetical protein